MKREIIGALVAKDVTLYFRNRLFAVLTGLGLVLYIVLYLVMPSMTEDNFKIGVSGAELPPVFTMANEEGLEIVALPSEEALKEAVLAGEYIAGIGLPDDIMEQFAAGGTPKITLYFTPDVPAETKDAMELLVSELAFAQTGHTLAVDFDGELLGPDTTGEPLTLRDRMRPLLAVFILMTEMLGLASLITTETEQRTANALMITPVTVTDFFTAKAITGTALAFLQAVLFMIIAGGLSHEPILILLILLLGSILVTGIAFLVASGSKDFMSVLGWGILAFLVAALPSFSIMLPGLITGWVKAIPTYYLVDAIHRAANFGSGWSDLWPDLLILLGSCAVITWLGILVLRRKFQ